MNISRQPRFFTYYTVQQQQQHLFTETQVTGNDVFMEVML